MATMKDIARELGISVQSVSQALNQTGRLKEETRAKIIETARRMNYRPNVLAKGLRDNRTYLIGVVFPCLYESFFHKILGGIEEAIGEKAYDILIGNSWLQYSNQKKPCELASAESEALARMTSRSVDGIICTPNVGIPEAYEEVTRSGIPFLQLMKKLPSVEGGFLGIDNVRGGLLATRHLIDLGHEKIGFLGTPFRDYEEIGDRNKGYLKALISQGISLDTDKFEESCELTYHSGGAAALKLYHRNPDMTAIFAPTDMAALGAMKALTEHDVRVPEDISIVGYDDLDIAAYQVICPLTTVAQPKEELGLRAFALLDDQIESGKYTSLILEPELKIRKSTREVR